MEKKKQVFLQSLNIAKLIVGNKMVEGQFILLFSGAGGNNYFARQKTLIDVLGASLITCNYLSSVALETLYCHTI